MKNKMFYVFMALVLSAYSLPACAHDHKTEHKFPELGYSYDALEPYIDAATMELHYDRHHRGYFNNFVNAIKGTELENKSLKEVFEEVSKHGAVIRNHGGGFYNHNLFWENMAPQKTNMSNKLSSALVAKYGSVDNFKSEFGKAASTVFGSGWAWLIVLPNGELAITSTPNQDNPLMDVVETKGTPILALDVWEHAYYLKYQNRRGDYISSFWEVVSWEVVSKRYEKAMK